MSAVAVANETQRQRFYRIAAELLGSNERVAIVIADIGESYLDVHDVFERHPRRAINVGIREPLMVSVAGGMALEGMRPIAHSYAPFLIERSFEQIKLDFGHQGVGGILVSVGASHDWTEGGRTHQAPEDVALMNSLPDWRIHAPGHPDEVESLLRSAAETDEAVYIRLSDAVNESAYVEPELSVVRTASEGGAPTVLAIGPMLRPTLEATAELDATVLYTHTPRPLDAGTLRAAVRGTEIIVVEPYLEGTSAAAVTAAFAETGRAMRLLSIGVKPVELRHYGTRLEHDRAHGIDAAGICARVDACLH